MRKPIRRRMRIWKSPRLMGYGAFTLLPLARGADNPATSLCWHRRALVPTHQKAEPDWQCSAVQDPDGYPPPALCRPRLCYCAGTVCPGRRKLLLEPVGLVAQLQARPLQLLLHGGKEDVVLACSRAVRPALDFLSRTQHQQESQGQATDGVLHIGSAQVYPTPGSIRTKTLQLRSIKKLSFRRHSRDKKSGPISGATIQKRRGLRMECQERRCEAPFRQAERPIRRCREHLVESEGHSLVSGLF